ncbi:MAG TPA: hypothetical protein PKB02_11790 [Anaerohalosphaeraceae bacterium]|nr:hypothetical protein [Anaerohalosphaeraceae bacterium]
MRILRVGLVVMLLCVLAGLARGAGEVAARKLFPQITDGIYNAAGQLVMNCRIAADGLTVTDGAWETYSPPAGKGKRWSFNQTPYSSEPLVNYRFDEAFSGLQVTINVEIFNLAKPWEVSESYQEILQLGGRVRAELPAWFGVPQDRLAYDFDEGTWFPSGWSVPKGKFACWEGAAKYKQKDRGGRHPMLDFGFTHVAENTISAGGHVPDKQHQCRVFGDAEWLDMSRGGDQSLWHNDGWKSRGERMEIVIPDFENADHWKWNPQQFDAFRELVTDFKRARPECLLGCWGVGVTNHSLRIFDHFDADGRPTGVVNLAAAEQWAGRYDKPEVQLNRIFDYCGLNFGNPSVYWLNGGNPAHLYAVMQEWEMGKLARPDIPNVISTWIQTEFVDGYPLSTYRFKGADGTYQTRGIKHQAPPSLVYAFSLFAHCRMDGAYCWETGTIYSEDVADAGELGEGGMQKPVRRTFNGVDKDIYYYIKYFGFYNYHVLGMWQAGRNKDIIEAKTEWFMPELFTSQGKTWRVDKERYPSYCNYYQEPLVRAKFSGDRGELLVVACNPYNRGVQTVRVREPGAQREVSFELIGDYPVIKRFKFGQKPLSK